MKSCNMVLYKLIWTLWELIQLFAKLMFYLNKVSIITKYDIINRRYDLLLLQASEHHLAWV